MSSRLRWRVIREVAGREIASMIRTRAWRVATLLLVLIVLAAVFAAAAFGGGEGDNRREAAVGYIEPLPELWSVLAQTDRSDLDLVWIEIDPTGVATALEDEGVAVVLESRESFVWASQVDEELDLTLRAALQEVVLSERAASLGLDRNDLSAIFKPLEIGVRFIEDPGDDDEDRGIGVGVALAVLTLAGLQTYGNLLVIGVVQEKASRVAEVLLAHIRARELLMGKILGLGLLAVTQLVAIFLAAGVALTITGLVAVSGSIWWVAAFGLISFVLGFGWFATVLAAAGSLVSRQEDAQQVVAPVVIPLVLVYFFSIVAVSADINGLAARLLSVIPLSSPFAMPMRVAAGAAPVWEIALAVALLVVAVFVAAAIAGRIYEFTLLRTGTRISYRDALRLRRRDP